MSPIEGDRQLASFASVLTSLEGLVLEHLLHRGHSRLGLAEHLSEETDEGCRHVLTRLDRLHQSVASHTEQSTRKLGQHEASVEEWVAMQHQEQHHRVAVDVVVQAVFPLATEFVLQSR